MGRRLKVSNEFARYMKERAEAERLEVESEARQQELINETSNKQLVEAMQLLLDQLKSRNIPVYDFDDKDKQLVQFQIIGERIYFLATKGEV